MTILILSHFILMNFNLINLKYYQSLSMKEINSANFLFSNLAFLQKVRVNILQLVEQIS